MTGRTAPGARPAAPPPPASSASLPRVDDSAWDGHALLGRAERVASQAKARGALQAECFLESGADLGIDLEAGRIASTGTSRGAGGSVRLVTDGGRVGFAYFTRDEDVASAIDAALRNARHAPPLGYRLPASAGPAPSLPGRWDARIAALQAEDAVLLARDLVQGVAESCPDGLLSGGGVGLEAGVCAIASTEGIALWDRSTKVGASASVVLEDGERSVSASEGEQAEQFKVDAHAVGLEAGRRTASLAGPSALPKGGRMDLVMRPEAASELVAELALGAVMGDDAKRGKSVWSNRMGEAVADSRLQLFDDPFAAGAVGSVPFDDEGLPVRKLVLVEAGVLRTFLFDTWDAHRHKERSTHSAVRGGFKSRPATGTHHVTLSSTPMDLDRMVAGVDEGLLVDSVLGAHTANVTTGDFSVTSPNVWRIHNGAVAGPVKEVALAGNLPDLLQHLDASSRDVKRMDGMAMPHLRIRGVDVSI